MEFRDIMTITSYEQLFNTVTAIMKTYIKNGEDILYIENGVTKKLEDVDEKKKILAIINLYIMLHDLIKRGISIEEIDKGLQEQKYQNKVLENLLKISQSQNENTELYVFTKELMERYDAEETRNQRAYQILRERVCMPETMKIVQAKEYSPRIKNNTDIVYILKQAQFLNLNGEDKDYIKVLLSNPYFVEKLVALKNKIQDENGKIEWEFEESLLENAKQLAEEPKVLNTQAQRDNFYANEYLVEEARTSQKNKENIIQFNEISLIERAILSKKNQIVFLEKPRKGHVSLLRILLRRAGYFAKFKEEDGQFIIDMISIKELEKPKVDVEPKN